jgi:hypothetical protein
VGAQVVDELVDLVRGRLAALRAREHVDVDVRHTARPRVRHSRGRTGVRLTDGLVGTHDTEAEAVVAEASPPGRRHRLQWRQWSLSSSYKNLIKLY